MTCGCPICARARRLLSGLPPAQEVRRRHFAKAAGSPGPDVLRCERVGACGGPTPAGWLARRSGARPPRLCSTREATPKQPSSPRPRVYPRPPPGGQKLHGVMGVDRLVRPDCLRQAWGQFLALSAKRLDRNRRQDGVDGVVVGSHEERPLEPRPDSDPWRWACGSPRKSTHAGPMQTQFQSSKYAMPSQSTSMLSGRRSLCSNASPETVRQRWRGRQISGPYAATTVSSQGSTPCSAGRW